MVLGQLSVANGERLAANRAFGRLFAEPINYLVINPGGCQVSGVGSFLDKKFHAVATALQMSQTTSGMMKTRGRNTAISQVHQRAGLAPRSSGTVQAGRYAIRPYTNTYIPTWIKFWGPKVIVSAAAQSAILEDGGEEVYERLRHQLRVGHGRHKFHRDKVCQIARVSQVSWGVHP